MRSNTVRDQKLSMLMACASPGSALAFHLGLTTNKAELLRRTSGTGGEPGVATADVAAAGTGQAAAVPARSFVSWLSGLFARVERWSANQWREERERYLAQAQNVSDLEARMRDLQSSRFWLP